MKRPFSGGALASMFAGAISLFGCSPPATTDDAGIRRDVVRDANQTMCVTDLDCTDGLFCNGVELCTPGAPGANAFGCVPPTITTPCLPDQRCVEGLLRCLTDCTRTEDADGDGHRAGECGGDDCDDADRTRFPGNAEVCDPFHDEDCDLGTIGTRDDDGDGVTSSACCNIMLGTPAVCGQDCDDSTRNVHPQAPEVCDGVDNNCNGVTDEGLPMQTWYPDCDGDMFGAAGSTGTPSCAAPTTAPTCTMPSAASGWASNARDCDDADDGRHPGVLELCDNFDNNCDGTIDEDPAASRSCGIGQNGVVRCTAGRCLVASCTSGFGDCDGNASNGCESDLRTDVDHCGSCATTCGSSSPSSGRACVASACVDVPCPPGYHYCGGRCVAMDSVDACGLSCAPCPVPMHGHAACLGTCSVVCDAGYVQFGNACVLSPRLVAPISGSVVDGTGTQVRYEMDADTSSVTLEFCRDRACAMVITSGIAPGMPYVNTATAAATLPAGVVYWRVRTPAATSPVWWFVVRGGSGASGASVGHVLDVNADGLVDLAVAAPGAMANEGRVYIHQGTATGLSTTPSATLSGPAGMANFGSEVVDAGDVDGDGFSDVAVTAPQSGSGRVYVFRGSASGIVATPASTLVGIDGAGSTFGVHAVSLDANADGYSDLAITSGSAQGASVFVYFGGPSGIASNPSEVIRPAGAATFGQSIAAGDVSGDGVDDLAIGDPTSPAGGSVYVYYGQTRGFGQTVFSSFADMTVDTATPNNGFGTAVALGFDFNGDGFGDLAVGAPAANSGAGQVVVVSSFRMSGGLRWASVGAPGDALGTVLTAIGDLDSDRYDDLASGNPATGVTKIVRFLALATPLAVASPDGAGIGFGASFAHVGDIDRDHFDDLVVSADAFNATGRVYVFNGGAAGPPSTPGQRIDSTAGTNAHFGRSLAMIASSAADARVCR